MTIRFDDRVAIVTGSGAGLGRSHAMLLASRGAKVVVNDPGGAVDGRGGQHAVADKVVAEIKAAGGQAVANYDSVADMKGAQNIIDTAVSTWGRCDILVNNAGILRDKAFANMSMEDFEFTMQVHFMGTVYCTKAAWPIMCKQQYGRVVVTTSGSGTVSNFGQSNYGGERSDQRAAGGGREIQHPVQRDLARGVYAHDREFDGATHGKVHAARASLTRCSVAVQR
jgi:NAD(P)-dependent dehydrogenase (short-subunit alcohol dehydrogenase family)